MTHHTAGVRIHRGLVLPRGLIVGGLALSSWLLVLALATGVSTSFSFLIGA
ncbi:hypothetical protein D3C87_1798940 [compost metagenome]